jgi:hypothetical protein
MKIGLSSKNCERAKKITEEPRIYIFEKRYLPLLKKDEGI